jgi:hypothetical protein
VAFKQGSHVLKRAKFSPAIDDLKIFVCFINPTDLPCQCMAVKTAILPA